MVSETAPPSSIEAAVSPANGKSEIVENHQSVSSSRAEEKPLCSSSPLPETSSSAVTDKTAGQSSLNGMANAATTNGSSPDESAVQAKKDETATNHESSSDAKNAPPFARVVTATAVETSVELEDIKSTGMEKASGVQKLPASLETNLVDDYSPSQSSSSTKEQVHDEPPPPASTELAVHEMPTACQADENETKATLVTSITESGTPASPLMKTEKDASLMTSLATEVATDNKSCCGDLAEKQIESPLDAPAKAEENIPVELPPTLTNKTLTHNLAEKQIESPLDAPVKAEKIIPVELPTLTNKTDVNQSTEAPSSVKKTESDSARESSGSSVSPLNKTREPSPRKRRLQSEVEDFNREDRAERSLCEVYKLTEQDLESTSLAKYVRKILNPNEGLAKLQFPEDHFKFRYEAWDQQQITFENPIKQHIRGIGGVYEYTHADIKAMKLQDFKKHDEKLLNEKQRKREISDQVRYFWKRLSPFMPPSLYGADMPGTLFEDDSWGLGNLDSCLKLLTSNIPGVTEPYLYAGTFGSVFCAHTEDLDLLSINYLHGGAPKVWYAVSMRDSQRFRNLAEHHYPHLHQTCPEFLRHKQCLISPTILRKAGIAYQTTVQYPGEAVVTFPGSYHFGFNLGFNLAEATNFGIPEWIPIGKKSHVCLCRPDSVRIDMKRLDELNCLYEQDIIRNHRMSYSEWRKRNVLKLQQQQPVKKPKKRKRIKEPSEQQKKKEFWIHVFDKTNPDLWHLAQPVKRRLGPDTKILYLAGNEPEETCHRGVIVDVQDNHYKIHLEGSARTDDKWLPIHQAKIYLDGGVYKEDPDNLPTLHYWQEMDSAKREEEY